MSEFQGSRHEEPDTAAIRATFDMTEDPQCVLDLCDALDAARAGLGLSINALVVARAERDDATRLLDEYDARWFALHAELDAARAERERTVGEYIIAIDAAWTRAEAAEARIAAALAEYHADDFNADRAYAMFLALTEGTGQ